MTRLGVTLLCAMALACPAQAATPLQQTARLLCVGLRDTYAHASTPGWRITFKACRPANYDRVVGVQHFWVWYAVVHNHRVSLSVCKVDATGTPVAEPVQLSPWQYDHLKTPAPTA